MEKKPICFVFEWGSPLEGGKSCWTCTHSVDLVSLEASMCLCFVLKRRNASAITKESPLWHILDKGPDYSSELTGERKEDTLP